MRLTNLGQLRAAVLVECRRRFAGFAGREWTEDLARGCRGETLHDVDETERKAREVFARLLDAAWAAVDFVGAEREKAPLRAWPGAPPEAVENYRDAFGSEAASLLRTLVDGDLRVLLYPPPPRLSWTIRGKPCPWPRVWPKGQFRRDFKWAAPLPAGKTLRARVVDDLVPPAFDGRDSLPQWFFFGTGRMPKPQEVAVIALLCGTFPESIRPAKGYTVAEVIRLETDIVSESLRRRRPRGPRGARR